MGLASPSLPPLRKRDLTPNQRAPAENGAVGNHCTIRVSISSASPAGSSGVLSAHVRFPPFFPAPGPRRSSPWSGPLLSLSQDFLLEPELVS